MKYPFVSFAASVLLYFLMVLFFVFVVFKKTTMPLISLTIDSEVFGEVVQHKKSREKITEVQKDSLAKSEITRSREEKLEPDEDKNNKESQHHNQKSISQKLAPLHQPLPEIPYDLRYEAFNSFAVARFYILSSGEVENVDLIKPCHNPKLNQLLLKALKNWKFSPSKNGATQDIRVTFRVE